MKLGTSPDDRVYDVYRHFFTYEDKKLGVTKVIFEEWYDTAKSDEGSLYRDMMEKRELNRLRAQLKKLPELKHLFEDTDVCN